MCRLLEDLKDHGQRRINMYKIYTLAQNKNGVLDTFIH